MLTQETKDQIKTIAASHLAEIDMLKVYEVPLVEKAQRIQSELPAIYTKLESAKILPESITFDAFMQITRTYLQKAFQEAAIAQAFSF